MVFMPKELAHKEVLLPKASPAHFEDSWRLKKELLVWRSFLTPQVFSMKVFHVKEMGVKGFHIKEFGTQESTCQMKFGIQGFNALGLPKPWDS